MAASKSLALGGRTDGFGAFLIVAVAHNERLLTVELSGSTPARRGNAIGASRSLPRVPAKVP